MSTWRITLGRSSDNWAAALALSVLRLDSMAARWRCCCRQKRMLRTGALGDVASGVAHEGGAALHAARPRVLWNRVRLHPDDFSTSCLHGAAVSCRLRMMHSSWS